MKFFGVLLERITDCIFLGHRNWARVRVNHATVHHLSDPPEFFFALILPAARLLLQVCSMFLVVINQTNRAAGVRIFGNARFAESVGRDEGNYEFALRTLKVSQTFPT